MTIQDIIKESGRLPEVMEIVLELSTSNGSVPIRPTIDNEGKLIFRVYPDEIRKGIKLWNKYLSTTGEEISTEDSQQMFAFSEAVRSALETLLHNYANACSHRKQPDESELEMIRAFQVLNSSINYMFYRYGCDEEDDSFSPFTIPEGWHKLKSEEDI